MAVYSLALILFLVALRVEATQLYAWGVNDYGQLGLNGSIVRLPQPIPAYTKVTIKDLKASGTYHMAISDTGDVYVTGNNWYGALGLPLSSGHTQVAPKLNANLKGCSLFLGKRHGNAVCGSTFVGWGVQSGYVLNYTTGNYGKVNASLPSYQLGSNVVNVTAGSRFSIVTINNGTMVVAGDGSGGVLGINDTSPQSDFVKFDGFTKINVPLQKIFPSIAEHVCAISQGYSLYCWGQNTVGQLGLGHEENQSLPTLVEFFEQDYYVIQVATGLYHTLALTAGGRVFAWGLGSNGVLGNGASDNSTFSTPIEVTFLADKDVVEIVAGLNFNFARTSKNVWYSWGAGYAGVLGTLNDMDVPVPTIAFIDRYNISRIVTASTSRSVYGWMDPTAPTTRTGPPLVNECETSPGSIKCAANAHCEDTDRRSICVCDDGFAGSNATGCTDIDECETTPTVCVTSAQCSNLLGSYNCSCTGGYLGDGKSTGSGCVPPPTPKPTPTPTPTPKPTQPPTNGPTNGGSTTQGSNATSANATTTSTAAPGTTLGSTGTLFPGTTSGGGNSTNTTAGSNSTTTDNNDSTTGSDTNPASTTDGAPSTSSTGASTSGKTNLYQTLFASSTSTATTGDSVIIDNGNTSQQHDKNVMIGLLVAFAVLIAIVIGVGIFLIFRARRPRRA